MKSKKFILVLAISMLGTAIYAQTPNPLNESFTIKITSKWSGGDVLTFMGKDGYKDDTADPNADVEKIMNPGEGSINLYGIVGGKHYSTVAKKHLEGTLIGLMTNEFDTHYEVEFTTATYAEGRDTLFFEDMKKRTLTKIVKGTKFSIDFETAKKDTIENRFRIYKPDTGDLEVCHENGKLIIKNNPYISSDIVVKGENGEGLTITPTSTPQEISLETLDAGHYTVEFNGGEKKYIIAVKPEMKTEETPAP